MDDPELAWPAWKFGMKRDDLFTKLQIQYNTIPSSLQDPEAFHHDVFEIANVASTTDEFHRLMADRKEQRLRELDDVFESASLEIIANPSLIGTAQWHLAVQLFRTKSFDALVRYFTSYIPDHHPWHHREPATKQSILDSHDLNDLPLSPQSMTMYSDESDISPSDLEHHKYILDNYTPSRTLSFSETEPDEFGFTDLCPPLHDDNTSQSSGATSSVSSIIDPAEAHQKDIFEVEHVHIHSEDAVVVEVANSMESADLDSPTPKPTREVHASSFFELKPSPLSSSLRRHRSPSPSRAFPLAHVTHHDCRRSTLSPRARRRDCSPIGRREQKERRRMNPSGTSTDAHSPLPEQVRLRRRGRGRAIEQERTVELGAVDNERSRGC